MTRRVGAALVALAILACGGGDGGDGGAASGASGTCAFEAFGICSAYAQASPDVLAAAEQGCSIGGGSWGTPCPSANVVGTCAVVRPTYSITVTFTPGFYGNAAEAAPACAQMGGAFDPGTATEGPATPQAFACDQDLPEGRVCNDFSGSMSAERRRALEALCGPTGLLPSGTACPSEGRVGTCATPDALPGITVHSRFYDPLVAASVAADCAAEGGTWTAG